MTVLVTRPRGQASGFAGRLRRMGIKVFAHPAIRIIPPKSYAPLDKALRKIGSYDWLIFTSANAVDSFLKRARRLRIRPAALMGLKTCSIGPATAKAMRKAGMPVSKISRDYVAESVLDALPSVKGMKILIPRARDAREVLPQGLRKRGARVDAVDAYRTVLDKRGAQAIRRLLAGPGLDCAAFTSASTVKNFFLAAGRRPKGVIAASIGPVTTRTLLSYGWKPSITARKPTTSHLAQAILNHYKGYFRGHPT
ncbi:MAG: hypothetical protein A3A86_03730 [Elusimicrobia bacterium RIFCSPLOWO2_01_FULL_60_11]|nr:MAG: hypothetical protein A3A86_03730 [Elusimicrobia bacterium RIFCSPLOWO2_01_FULL_60_11]